MRSSPRRRMLLGAGILPATLSLAGCGPFRRQESGGPGDDGPSQGGAVTADGPATSDPPPSPDRCLSAEEAAQRTRPEPPAREDIGPENEALPGEHLSIFGLTLLDDGDRIAANQTSDALMLGDAESFGTVIWSTADGSILEKYDNGLVGAIAVDHQGHLAIGGTRTVEMRSAGGEVTGVMTSGEEPFGPRVGPLISDLVFTVDGSRLVVLGADQRITVWTLGEGGCGMEHELATDHTSSIALSISPVDGTLAVCGESGPVELWDAATGSRTGTVEGLPGDPAGLAYTEDGTLIVCTDGERAFHAVSPAGEITTGPELNERGPYWVTTAPGGRVAQVSRNSNRVTLWERESDEITELPVVSGSAGRIRFSSDGETLYGASPGNGVIAWSGGEWRTFEAP